MTASTSLDRSVSDDALASGGPTGEGGFDPSKPVAGRERDCCPFCNCTSLSYVVEQQQDGKFANGPNFRCDSCKCVFLRIDPTIPTVPPTPAGDMAGEDDATFVERMIKLAHRNSFGHLLGFDASNEDQERFFDLAREGARREPVAGDGWRESIETAIIDAREAIRSAQEHCP